MIDDDDLRLSNHRKRLLLNPPNRSKINFRATKDEHFCWLIQCVCAEYSYNMRYEGWMKVKQSKNWVNVMWKIVCWAVSSGQQESSGVKLSFGLSFPFARSLSRQTQTSQLFAQKKESQTEFKGLSLELPCDILPIIANKNYISKSKAVF